jgi:hypothetical protein
VELFDDRETRILSRARLLAAVVRATDRGWRPILVGDDGVSGSEVPPLVLTVGARPIELGRKSGPAFAGDDYLGDRRVGLVARDGGVAVQWSGAAPVLLRAEAPVEMHDGDRLSIGLQWIEYRATPSRPRGRWGTLAVLQGDGRSSVVQSLLAPRVLVGRDEGDLAFPDDEFVSRRHAEIVCGPGGVFVRDLGSRNGTFLALRNGDVVPDGSVLLVGATAVAVHSRVALAA